MVASNNITSPWEQMRRLINIAIIVAVVGTFGCAAHVSTPADSRKFLWPLPPDRPRIEWVNTYSSQLDLPKDFFGRLKTASIGEDDPISLRKPVDIKAVKGVVAVADPGASSVYIFDLVQNELYLVPEHRQKNTFSEPIALAADDKGNFYALDGKDQKIYVFDAKGKILNEIDLKNFVQRGVGLRFDGAGRRLLVTDADANKVVALSLAGDIELEIGRPGGGDGEFNIPVDVTVNTKGNIIVADAMNARIQVFDPKGVFLFKFGRRGDGPSDFQQIKAVATDSDNNIYVTDARSHRIIIYSSSGDYLLSVGGFFPAVTSQKGPGGFVLPQGIDIDENDFIYVVDQMNRRFQVFRYLSERKKIQDVP